MRGLIQEKLKTLLSNREQAIAQVNVINGAIDMCKVLIDEMDEDARVEEAKSVEIINPGIIIPEDKGE